jgi:hypothetical protein
VQAFVPASFVSPDKQTSLGPDLLRDDADDGSEVPTSSPAHERDLKTDE